MSNPLRSTLHHRFALLAGFVLCLAWLIPNHYPPWASFYNDSCMAIGLVVLAASLLLGRGPSAMPIVAWIAIAIAAIPWVQWCFGLVPFAGDAWTAMLYLFGFASAITIGYQWDASKGVNLAVLLSVATLVAACISCLIGSVQTLHGGVLSVWSLDGKIGMQAQGNLGQPNNLATLIGIGAVSLLYLRERQLLGKAASVCILALLIFGAVLTRSRTALLFGPAIVIGLCFFVWVLKGALATKPLSVVIATAAHWLAAMAWSAIQPKLLFSSAPSLVERGLQTSRFQAWPKFVEALNDAPWTGYGWLQSAEAQYAVANNDPPVGELYAQAHNLLLELIVWCGYPLGLFLCGLIVYWFISRALKITTIEALCGLLAVSVLAVHSMLELPYHYAYFLIPAGLWMGIIESSVAARSALSPKWTPVTMLATTLLFIAIAHTYLEIEKDFRLARFEYLKIGALRGSQQAQGLPLLTNLTAFVRIYRTKSEAGMSSDELSEMYAVTKRYPYPRLLYGYAVALELNNRHADAREVFLRIRHLHGQRMYAGIKSDLHERVVHGQNDLRVLEASLP